MLAIDPFGTDSGAFQATPGQPPMGPPSGPQTLDDIGRMEMEAHAAQIREEQKRLRDTEVSRDAVVKKIQALCTCTCLNTAAGNEVTKCRAEAERLAGEYLRTVKYAVIEHGTDVHWAGGSYRRGLLCYQWATTVADSLKAMNFRYFSIDIVSNATDMPPVSPTTTEAQRIAWRRTHDEKLEHSWVKISVGLHQQGQEATFSRPDLTGPSGGWVCTLDLDAWASNGNYDGADGIYTHWEHSALADLNVVWGHLPNEGGIIRMSGHAMDEEGNVLFPVNWDLTPEGVTPGALLWNAFTEWVGL